MTQDGAAIYGGRVADKLGQPYLAVISITGLKPDKYRAPPLPLLLP